MKRDWLKLKENKCPVCGNKIIRVLKQIPYECTKCKFYCRYKKAQKIIADVESKKFEKKQDKIADDWIKERS